MYETVIGLEVHVELATATKIFCGCSTAFGAEPNTQVCPVCAGLPGALPVLNRRVVELAAAVGLATHCEITRRPRFDRKNYFYPDNPQNYQISQLYLPICRDGYVEIRTPDGTKQVRIHEIHMEEDAGKLTHDERAGLSYVDYNRSGVPLIEIVSEPDMRDADEVLAYLEALRETIQYLGASDCKLQEGSMRADVNLSVRRVGSECLGTRTETKNLNSMSAISRAIADERERQIGLLERGEAVIQETRRWNDDEGYSYAMRSKEDAQDYRYFPDPDLPELVLDEAWLAEIKAAQPEFRPEKRARYISEYGLPEYDADIITADKALTDLFEATVAVCGRPKKVSNWLMGETLRILKDRSMDASDITVSPEHLASLVTMADERKVSNTAAKQIFEHMFDTDCDPLEYAEAQGLIVQQDDDLLRSLADTVIGANPQSVADYRAGKQKALGFLVGQGMKAAGGSVDPAALRAAIEAALA